MINSIKIACQVIMYVEAINSYVKIVTEKEGFILRQSMHTLETFFPSYFFRIHRSYLGNLLFAQTIEPRSLSLPNNLNIPISRDTYGKLIECLRTING